MSRWLKRIAFVVLMFVAVNDGGRYINGYYQLASTSRDMAFVGAQAANANPARNSGWPVVARMAQEHGIEVTGYEQGQGSVTISTRLLVPGTYILGPVLALIDKRPYDSPIVLDHEDSSTG